MVTRRIAFARTVGLTVLAVLVLLTSAADPVGAAPAADGNIPALPTVTTTPGEAPASTPAAEAPAPTDAATPAAPAPDTPTTDAPGAAAPATGAPAGTPATGTPAPGAPADPNAPATGQVPATGAPATGVPSAGTPTTGTTEAAATAKPKDDDHLDAWVWGAIAGAIVLVAGLGWALVIATGRIPWMAPVGHAMGEAGWRLSLRWAEFTDWLRFGSGR